MPSLSHAMQAPVNFELTDTQTHNQLKKMNFQPLKITSCKCHGRVKVILLWLPLAELVPLPTPHAVLIAAA